MFTNFIYLIIALLILALYEAPQKLTYSLVATLVLFGLSLAIFTIYTRWRFQRLARRVAAESRVDLDHSFSKLSTHHCILALIFFAVNIWWLHLPAFLEPVALFSLLPTLKSLTLMILFIGYLTLVWLLSHDAHRRIYQIDFSPWTYVYSNIAFSVPILIPWTLLFGIIDIVRLLPFDPPKRILASAVGQTSYFLIFLIIAAIFAPVVVKLFWRCRPLEEGEHRRRIEALCRRAGVGYADIVRWPIFGGRMLTAGVMGLVSRFRYIMVTEALLQLLSPDEIDQVMAHEIGHVKGKHILCYMLFLLGFMLISYTTYPLTVMLLFFDGPLLDLFRLFDLNPFNLLPTIYALNLIIAVSIYFRYIFGYFMRNFERQADVYVFRLYPTAQPLISTFDKIVANSGQPADKPNWHHFSIQQRIDYLNKCQAAPRWIKLHNQKIKKSIIAFLGAITLMALASYQLNKIAFSQENLYLNIAGIEAALDQKPTKNSDDAHLYWMLGNIYFEHRQFAKALSAYEAVLLISPHNPDALNNLAWLLATIQDPHLKDPQRAIALAHRAIKIRKAPHIWDTLAQSLFANGQIEAAIEAENQALAMNPAERQIYTDQLAKFRRALTE